MKQARVRIHQYQPPSNQPVTDSGNETGKDTSCEGVNNDTNNDSNTDTEQNQGDDNLASDEDNQAPVISVLAPSEVKHGQSIELTASATDPEGGPLSYVWQQLSGQSVTLSAELSLSFTIPEANSGYDEIYRFSLTVSDEYGAQSKQEFEFVAKTLMDTVPASRLLHQAGIGPTYSEILAAEGVSAQDWIEAQIQLPITYHVDYLENYPDRDYPRQINRIDTASQQAQRH